MDFHCNPFSWILEAEDTCFKLSKSYSPHFSLQKNKIESSFSKWKPFFSVWLGGCLRALGLFLFPEFLTGHLDFHFSLNPILYFVAKTISKFKFDHFTFWGKNLCSRIKIELFELFCVNFFTRPSSLKCPLLPVPKTELLLHCLKYFSSLGGGLLFGLSLKWTCASHLQHIWGLVIFLYSLQWPHVANGYHVRQCNKHSIKVCL